jgi:hypothetical protein
MKRIIGGRISPAVVRLLAERMNDAVQIECMYSCSSCGIVKARVKIDARHEGQTITDWLSNVAVCALVKDHSARSPRCRANKLDEFFIPTGGADIIGGPAIL